MIKVFDLDGTLLDSNGVWHQVDVDFVARRGLELTDEYCEFISHAIFPVAAEYTKRYYSLPETEEEIMAEWHALAFDAYANQLPMKPGVAEYLARCAGNGEKMAVYTSGVPDLCKAALKRHGIIRYFDSLYFAQELRWEKRHAESFTKLAREMGQMPEECILFDDSPVACTSARTAGWQVIGIRDRAFLHYEEQMRQVCHQYISGFEALL